MRIVCPKCTRRYDFATLRLQGKDRKATCTGCGHRFIVRLMGRPTSDGTETTPDADDMTAAGEPASRRGDTTVAPHVRIALTALGGPIKDETFLISRNPTVIGRVQGDIRVPDPKVSGRHAQVELAGGEVWLRDLGSTNGTFVNGERIDRVRLAHMDEVVVGATRLLYTYIEDFASAYDALAPEA